MQMAHAYRAQNPYTFTQTQPLYQPQHQPQQPQQPQMHQSQSLVPNVTPQKPVTQICISDANGAIFSAKELANKPSEVCIFSIDFFIIIVESILKFV